jgi:hypothetical protein
LKNGQNKCPIFNSPKNFPEKKRRKLMRLKCNLMVSYQKKR